MPARLICNASSIICAVSQCCQYIYRYLERVIVFAVISLSAFLFRTMLILFCFNKRDEF